MRKKKKHLQYEQKIWADTSPKKIYRCQISIFKDTQYHMSLGNCKLKGNTITHPTENLQLKSERRKLAIPNVGGDV